MIGMDRFDIVEADGSFRLLQGGVEIAQYETRETAELMGDFSASALGFWGIRAHRSWAPTPITDLPASFRAPLWAERVNGRH